MRFKDRKDAGQMLARELEKKDIEKPYVFGLARGGVPVAYQVSKSLDAPLDVLVPRKLGVPGHEEFAFGAIAPKDVKIINEETIKRLEITEQQVEAVINKEKKEMKRRIERFRGDADEPEVMTKTVIVVDDGLATGATALASVRYLKKLKPRKVVLAVPVGSEDAVMLLQEEVDELICLFVPEFFNAVGQWYERFDQTSDKKVEQIISKVKK